MINICYTYFIALLCTFNTESYIDKYSIKSNLFNRIWMDYADTMTLSG